MGWALFVVTWLLGIVPVAMGASIVAKDVPRGLLVLFVACWPIAVIAYGILCGYGWARSRR